MLRSATSNSRLSTWNPGPRWILQPRTFLSQNMPPETYRLLSDDEASEILLRCHPWHSLWFPCMRETLYDRSMSTGTQNLSLRRAVQLSAYTNTWNQIVAVLCFQKRQLSVQAQPSDSRLLVPSWTFMDPDDSDPTNRSKSSPARQDIRCAPLLGRIIANLMPCRSCLAARARMSLGTGETLDDRSMSAGTR